MKYMVGGVLVAAALAGSGLAWSRYHSTEQALRRACVMAIEDTLLAPSTMQVREWSEMRVRAATEVEAIGPEPTRRQFGSLFQFTDAQYDFRDRKAAYEAGPPSVALVRVTYDSDNGYGTPVRGAARCTYMSDKIGSSDPVPYDAVKVDSASDIERILGNAFPSGS
ncbi:hypothetical protein U5903_07070 [Cereibacter johrii]|uniref:hypothetical protein n=1 Tax=Cereibacter johrii TaxID=445629 RepID=UPI002B261DCE|nr:hypothetical protein [Cereibacter johrii]MEA5160534.1 hypothetical protein [Cereibacter johrii]